LKIDDEQSALKYIEDIKALFPTDTYIEITDHPELKEHQIIKEKLIKIAKDSDTPLVAGHDISYLHPEDKIARDTMLMIQSSTERMAGQEGSFHFPLSAEMADKFKDYPEALANTQVIASDCNLTLDLGTWVFPNLIIPENTTYEEELRKLTYDGLERRKVVLNDEVKDRIEYELKIIIDKGFAPYFLVVADLLNFARANKILSNTRGSAAGSMVSYLCGITNVNPIEYKLPFERFLNPERPKAPDIDMDLADNRRDELIQYSRDKYGDDKVAQIGTFGKMMARGVVRDVARALGHPYGLGDQIAKLIPMGSQGFPMTIEKALEMEDELKEMYKKDKDVKQILDLGQKIEGCARHISVHAAGVVISPYPLTEFVPIQLDPKGGKLITQYDMHSVEEAGLLKFDFLGLKNLAILADAIRIVKKRKGIDVDLDTIPLDNKKTFEMLSRGETAETFQLNGEGMTKYLVDLKPTTIHDINAMIALYRPGPLEVIPEYIRRKNNPNLVNYPDPKMEKYLKESYGLIVYQDDVLLSAIELAGYSWLEVDKFRKAIGKKIPKEMAAQKEKFTKGVIEKGQTAAFAEKLWKLFEPFQAYGFNKAHAASYGQIAYATSYMKANYPIEYMAAVLTADAGNVDKISEIIRECDRMGIKVLPPAINESLGNFTVVESSDGEQIRFGLYSIKNFGQGIGDVIIEDRTNNGAFKSLEDFLSRIRDRNLNKKSVEALIKSGALDTLSDRALMLSNLESLLIYNKEYVNAKDDQDSLFGIFGDATLPKLRLNEATPIDRRELLAWEKELLGLYVSGHPLDSYKEILSRRQMDIKKVKNSMKEGMMCVVSGIVEDSRQIVTKGGEKMAFIKIADLEDNIETVVFPKLFVLQKDIISAEKCIAVKGRFSLRNGNPSVVAEEIREL
jgi:DNA polymerase III subunit alpha